ncbi:YfjI family protein [Psychrobacter sp. DAB_AL62B]|uniref:YfjI family protein n=1 Tax=Psychrobacter sp. DAB_AL62B TaxID=1028420 RepID=UPI0023818C9C|nr:YfjI family protein [Psychrobacter sp. DAB_AL62B]MDE4453974.1 DUF3987 domain-containing protein [Psychrobacter sp. DAB_AL62B]
MTIIDKTKPQADDKGLNALLGTSKQTTTEIITDDETITSLITQGQGDKLRQFGDTFTIHNGDRRSKFIDTAGKVALILSNNLHQPANLGIYTPNTDEPIEVTDPSQPSAFIIGNLSFDSDWYAVKSLAEGIELYKQLINQMLNVTILVSVNTFHFNKMVKHFAEVKQVIVTTTLEQIDQLTKPLVGLNVKAIITVFDLLLSFDNGQTLDDVLSEPETIIKDLLADAWADPKPINHTLPPVASITKDMLPKSLYDYAINTAERLSVPIEFVAVPLVVALGSVIGTKVAIMPKRYDNWDIVPNLWGAVIGKPSSKKSPSITEAMKPIDNLVSKARADYELNKQEHETQKLINDSKAKIAEKELKKLADMLASQTDDDNSTDKVTDDDLRQKAAFIADSKKQDESIPVPRRHMVGNITMEKLGEIENQNNNGVLQFRDELSGFLASLEKDGEQEQRAFYLSGFNGTGSEMVDRIGRGSLYIENHCLSVMGGIQPDKLEMYLEQTMRGLGNDGLMQRFQMMVYPDPLPRCKEKDIAVNKESRDAVYELFIAVDGLFEGKLVSYGANESNEYYKRPYFRFADDAYNVFMDWYDTLQAKADDTEHEVIAQHLLKYGRLIPALALIFHLVDCIEIGSRLGGVSLKALQAAIAWGDMLETHMLRVYSCITDNSHLKASLLGNKILALLKKPSDKTDKTDWISHGFTARSLKRKNWKGLTDDNAVQTAIDVLIEHDWLDYKEVKSTGQGGRPTERYWINPKLKSFI